MKKHVRKTLIIFILMMTYIIISLICGNKSYAISQTTTTDINSINSNQYPQIKKNDTNVKKSASKLEF